MRTAACAAGVALAAIGVLSTSGSHRHPPTSPLARKQVARLPVTLTPAASASIGASRRDLWPARRGGALVAKGGGIQSTFTTSGAALGVRGGTLQIGLTAFGRERGMRALAPTRPRARRNQVTYRRGAVSELYREGPYGLEQAFAIRSRPRDGDGRLQLRLRLAGSLVPRQVGSRLVFHTRGGRVALHYGQLVATDAAGDRLPAQMILRHRTLDLRIDDAGARYPITVDPFIQQGRKLTGEGEIGSGLFGTSVALSADGNTALIGGAADTGETGAAWVFTRSGSTWSQQGAKLTGSGAEGQSGFGSSVALSADGNTALIGGPRDNEHKGAAWVFTRSESVWTQQGEKLTGEGRVGKAEFGSSVALSGEGDTALIGGLCDGAHKEGGVEFTCEPTGAGAAWVFTRSGSTWSQQGAKLTGGGEVGGPVGGGLFGASVAISSNGNTALIGAILDNGEQGAAWVFTRSGSSWSQQGEKLTGSGEVEAGRFGSVALSGDGETALVGAYRDSAGIGAAWVFTRSGSTWSQQGAKLTGTGEVGAGRFGGVALSGDGNTALIGAPGDNGEVGAAWEFVREGLIWNQVGSKITSSDGLGKGNFGTSVAVSQDASTALIGGPSDGSIAPQSESKGAAWAFFQGASAATEAASGESQTEATLHGKVNPNGDATECKFEYGTTTTYGSSATCSPPPGSGEVPVAESASIVGLSPNTLYHFRIVATNVKGTSHGADVTFKTLPEPPDVLTEAASEVTQTTATLNATVNPNGGKVSECKLEYTTGEAPYQSVACSPEPGEATEAVPVSASVSSLAPDTTYNFRVTATNAGGTNTSPDATFKTLKAEYPVATIAAAAPFDQSSATLHGSVNPKGDEVSTCEFEYAIGEGPYQHANCAQSPGAGSSPVPVSASITGLAPNTTYRFRLVAKNALGASEPSGEQTFKTLPNAPTVETSEPTGVLQNAATLKGTVKPNGGKISQCKFEYGTSAYDKSATCSPPSGEGEGTIEVSATVGSLSANTTYKFRLAAENEGGSNPSSGREFKTLPNAPTVETSEPTGVLQNAATLKGTVKPNGGKISQCKFEYGTSAYDKSATCSPPSGEGEGTIEVSATVGSLSANTTYKFRLAAENEGGSNPSSGREFKTLPEAPTVLTETPSPVAQTTATFRGTVNPNGGNVSECKFEYGPTAAYGQSAACSSLPGEGLSPVAVSAPVSGLSANTTYHFRLVAKNAGGTTPGADETLKTLAPTLPVAVTQAATSVTHTAATLNASVNPNGASVTACTFEYGTTAAYGSSAPCASLPGGESAPTAVSAPIASLSATTTYHFRIVVANALGKAEGIDEAFTTAQAPPEAPSSPAGAPGASGPPPAAPQTPAVPDVKLVSRTLAVTASGAFKVKLTCPATESTCTGSIVFRTLTAVAAGAGRAAVARKSILTLAHASFSIAGGGTATVKLTLAAKARALLVRSRTLKAKATIIGRDPAGATHRRESTVTLLAAKGKPARR